MLFNSIEYFLFLPVVFLIYWFILSRNVKLQNLFIVFVSYIFYGWWDWRFLSLIIFSSFIDFGVGLKLKKYSNPIRRKILLFISIFVNLGLLGFFKYFNFFTDNIVDAFAQFGVHFDKVSINIILPVGISFYTFQTLSYSIDVYRKKLEPTKDIISFFAFVSFFPQLVAGPIERATNLLPQFYGKRSFKYSSAVDGFRQILWGLFKKVVIADNVAKYANEIFNHYSDYNGSTLLLGAIFFAFQIYGDFSGYSDIAIGTARLFGFNLMKNFAFPYFSRDIAEFWRRWHISLSTWFRDYVYIPLGGSKGRNITKIRNIFIIFLVSGFWHGANWTFIFWGFLNAIYFLPLLLMKKNRRNLEIVGGKSLFPNLMDLIQIIITFFLTLNAWVFFRSNSVSDAFLYLIKMYQKSIFSLPQLIPIHIILLLIIFIVIEWLNKGNNHALEKLPKLIFFRWSYYLILSLLIIGFLGNKSPFIYFQF